MFPGTRFTSELFIVYVLRVPFYDTRVQKQVSSLTGKVDTDTSPTVNLCSPVSNEGCVCLVDYTRWLVSDQFFCQRREVFHRVSTDSQSISFHLKLFPRFDTVSTRFHYTLSLTIVREPPSLDDSGDPRLLCPLTDSCRQTHRVPPYTPRDRSAG